MAATVGKTENTASLSSCMTILKFKFFGILPPPHALLQLYAFFQELVDLVAAVGETEHSKLKTV